MTRSTTRATIRTLAFAAAGTLVACATPQPETRVTRFHLDQPIAPGDVAVEPRNPQMAASLEYRSYADAVGAELSRLGFRLAPGVARSELVAVVDLNRTTREGAAESSPVSIGLGGGGFGGGRRGGGVGLGGGVSFPIGRAKSRYVTTTEMMVQLKRRSDGTVIWEGRAQQAARVGARGSDPAAAATALSHALFQGFPGESGRTISVR